MRVLYLTHRLPYAPNRGDRIRALNTLRVLAPHASVDLVSLVHSREEEGHADDLRDLAASVTVARVSRIMGYGRAAIALLRDRPLTLALLDSAAVTAACRRLIAEQPPDVLLALCSGMARFALGPPLNTFPLVLDMIDVDSEKWRELAHATTPPARWIYTREARCLQMFEAHSAQAARAVLVVNDRERSAMLRVAPLATVHTIPNGVDIESFRPAGAPSAERRVSFCGVMNYGPNEEGALWLAREVWPRVRARYPDARLSLVGSDPNPAVRRLAISDPSIEVTGAVPDVRPYLWRSAAAVAPLFVARGVQNKVLEAVAAALPCVVTPAVGAGLPNEVLPACLVALDVERFSGALIDLLGLEPHERRALAARANLGPLGWSARMASLLPILQEAAQPSGLERRPSRASHGV